MRFIFLGYVKMDDSMATPLSKLPPPQQHRKTDEQPAGAAVDYNSMRDEIFQSNEDRKKYTPEYEEYEPPQQHQQQQYQRQEYQEFQEERPVHRPRRRPQVTAAPVPAKRQILSVDTLKDKRIWLLAATIFILITFGIPKVRGSVPALVSPVTGKLSTPGLAIVSFAAAFAYTVALEFTG